MFQIGFVELLMLVIVVIIFLKPEDLPAFFRKIGRFMGEIKGFTRAFKWKMTELEIEEKKKKTENPKALSPEQGMDNHIKKISSKSKE